MGFDVLDGVIAGIGIQGIDRIHAVLAVAAAVTPLEDLHMHPMFRVLQAGKGNNP